MPKAWTREPKICPKYGKNMPKICLGYDKYIPQMSKEYAVITISGKVNFDPYISFTDLIVTKVCDIGLGKERSPSVTNKGILTFG